MVGSEPIDSLDSYRPAAKKYEVSLTFSGDAGHDIEELMVTMAVATPNEVVLHCP